jgi:phage-related minor tail protein
LNQGSDLRASNRKSSKGGGGSKKSPAEGLREYLEGLKQQADIEGKLVGLSGEKRDIQEAVLKAQQKYGEAFGPTQKKQLEAALLQNEAYKEQHRVLEEAKGQQEEVAGVIAESFGSAFMSIVEGTKSAKEAFKDMARSIVKQLFQILVVERMVKSIKGFIGGIGAVQADGGAWQGGSQIQAYANGGVVGGPTYFPMAGGKTGLMGEAGPEAIMPLKRGSNGKLGVQMEGSSQGNVVIHQSFNFQANGDDSVKKLIAQAAPQIANMTQKQIMDSRRRGGSMKAAFG